MKVYDVYYRFNYIVNDGNQDLDYDNIKNEEIEYSTTKKFRTTIPQAVSNNFFMSDTFELKEEVRKKYRQAIKSGYIAENEKNTFIFQTEYVETRGVNASDKTIKQTIKKDIVRILVTYLNSRKDIINYKDSFFDFCDDNKYDDFEDFEIFIDWDIKRIAKCISKQIDHSGLFIEELGEEMDNALFAMSTDSANLELRYFNQYVTNFIRPEVYNIYMLLFPNGAINSHRFMNLPGLY